MKTPQRMDASKQRRTGNPLASRSINVPGMLDFSTAGQPKPYQPVPLYPLMRRNDPISLAYNRDNVNPKSRMALHSRQTLNPNAEKFIPHRYIPEHFGYTEVENARDAAPYGAFPSFITPDLAHYPPLKDSPPKLTKSSESHEDFVAYFRTQSDHGPMFELELSSNSSTEVSECNLCVISECSDHTEGSAARFKSDLYKTEYCRNLSETGFCKYETECRFAHSAQELRSIDRPVGNKYRTVECNDYMNGICYFGSRCWFIHPQSDQKELEKLNDRQLVDLYFRCFFGTELDPFKNLKIDPTESRASNWLLTSL